MSNAQTRLTGISEVKSADVTQTDDLAVTDDAVIGGDVAITGSIATTGAANIGGNATLATASVTGAAAIGGNATLATASVTGAANLGAAASIVGSLLASVGGKIGSATSHGIAFYGTTTISQRAGTAQNTSLIVSDSIGTAAEAFLEEVGNTLTALGLWKGSN